jgi:glycosyltransferase involved in cell wall biosynthesis
MFDLDLLLTDKNLTLASCQMIPAVSIIVPAYEEQARLGDSIKQILAYIERERLAAELIVVDDGSKDNTAEIAETAALDYPDLQTKVIRYETNRGKGYAVRTGLLARKAILQFSPTPIYQRRLKNCRSSSSRFKTANTMSLSARALWTEV